MPTVVSVKRTVDAGPIASSFYPQDAWQARHAESATPRSRAWTAAPSTKSAEADQRAYVPVIGSRTCTQQLKPAPNGDTDVERVAAGPGLLHWYPYTRTRP